MSEKKDSKQPKRVWQSQNDRRLPKLIVVNTTDEKNPLRGVTITLKANHAAQYVVPENAPHYETQVSSMLRYAEKYSLKEVKSELEGIMPRIKSDLEGSKELRDKNEALEKELAELRAKLSAKKGAKVDESKEEDDK